MILVVPDEANGFILYSYSYKNNLKIMNLKKGVGIDHCNKE